jgi:hypothetical protein
MVSVTPRPRFSLRERILLALAPCSLVKADRRFRGANCLYHQGDHGAISQKVITFKLLVAISSPTNCNDATKWRAFACCSDCILRKSYQLTPPGNKSLVRKTATCVPSSDELYHAVTVVIYSLCCDLVCLYYHSDVSIWRVLSKA